MLPNAITLCENTVDLRSADRIELQSPDPSFPALKLALSDVWLCAEIPPDV